MPVAPTRDRHALTGRSVLLDPRIDAVRADLTDIRLADRVFAPHYAMAMLRTATVSTPLRAGAATDSPVLSELLPGDGFELLEVSHDVAWGRSVTDGVVGYVGASALDEPTAASHRVTAVAAMLREAPDANATTLASLPMGARLTSLGERGQFLLTDHGYVSLADVASVETNDPAGLSAAALAMIGLVERPGGRSGAGVDAAGLIFLIYDRCGVQVPRLADLQQAAILGDAGPVLWFERGSGYAINETDAVALIDGQVSRVPIARLMDGALGSLTVRGRLA